MDPCLLVKDTCRAVAEQSEHVKIDAAALNKMAESLATATSSAPPAWDECGWHYAADAASGGPATAQYIMVLDALNFCFWPSSTSMEYDTLAIVLRDQLTADPEAFSAAALSRMQASTLTAWFKAAGHDLPNAAERAKKLREVGTVLAADFGGSVAELVARAKGSAVALVGLVTRHFPGFRDEAVYKGQQVFFYKRAQIFVADLWAAYGKQTSGSSPYAFPDISRLTCFADYRIPQLLVATGVFRYSPSLSTAVDLQQEIPAGDVRELEIRACTVVAVESLRRRVNALLGREGDASRKSSAEPAALTAMAAAAPATGGAGATLSLPPLTSVEIDWYLWQQGEGAKDTIRPHHRVNTVFY